MVIPRRDVFCVYPIRQKTKTPVSPTMPKTDKPKSKRLSGQMRNEYLDRGAFLIEFAQPSTPMDMFRRQAPHGVGPILHLSGKELQSVTDKYRTMERKGYRVTQDTGCLIPEEQYSTYQQGASQKGHQRAFEFFGRWCPGAGNNIRNEFGWPMTPQVSHLCHRRSCARIDHLIAEEQWRNLKRNYCGFGGQCDCGNEIKCLRRYQMDNQADTPAFCNTKEEVKAALFGAPPFVIHSANRFANRDSKAQQRKANRDSRKRSQDLHEFATQRKQLRLGTVVESAEEAEQG